MKFYGLHGANRHLLGSLRFPSTGSYGNDQLCTVMSEIDVALQRLLSGDFNIDVLDQLVTAAYDPVSPHRAAANKALMQLQETPDLWTKADSIIENSNVPQCRFFGLQILDGIQVS